MKKLLLFSILVIGLMPFTSNAQTGHTLIFNQVLLVTSSATVPSGKVWKIEAVVPSNNSMNLTPISTSACTINTLNHNIVINGTTCEIGNQWLSNLNNSCAGVSNNSVTTGSEYTIRGPIWLPATSTLATGTGVAFISVLEFIVQ